MVVLVAILIGLGNIDYYFSIFFNDRAPFFFKSSTAFVVILDGIYTTGRALTSILTDLFFCLIFFDEEKHLYAQRTHMIMKTKM